MRVLRNTVFLFALISIAVAQPQKADFAKWWPQFQAAVAKHDAKAVASMMTFPLDWELGTVRKIQTAADFIAKFDAYFPADMVKAVATKKPLHNPNGEYTITWIARHDEYSLYFREDGKGGFVLWASSEGPA